MGRTHCSPGSQMAGFLLVACLLYDLGVISHYVCFASFLDGNLFSRGSAFYFCAGLGLKLLRGKKKTCSWLRSQSLIFANQIVAEINLPEEYFPLLKMTL